MRSLENSFALPGATKAESANRTKRVRLHHPLRAIICTSDTYKLKALMLSRVWVLEYGVGRNETGGKDRSKKY
jgi:hypothetical protein